MGKEKQEKKSSESAASKPNPVDSANIFSFISFSWAGPLINLGRKSDIKLTDLWELPHKEEVHRACEELEKAWNTHVAERKKQNRPVSLWRVLFDVYMSKFILGGFFMFLWSIFTIFQIYYIMNELVRYIEDPEIPRINGYLLAIAMFVCSMVGACCIHLTFYLNVTLGTRVRAAINMLGYKKALKLPVEVVDVGNIVNIITNDCQRFFECCLYMHFLWTAPVQCVAVTVLLGIEIKYAVAPGIALLIGFFIVQILTGKKIALIRGFLIKLTDQRVTLMSEILTAIKLVKLYAWEGSFHSKVAELRQREVKQIREQAVIKSINYALVFASPLFVAVCAFGAYVLAGNNLPASRAFTVLALFNLLRFPLTMMPSAVKYFAESIVGIKRLQEFLTLPELTNTMKPPSSKKTSFSIKKASFKWSSKESTMNADSSVGLPENKESNFMLQDIDIKVKRGELVAIVGEIGSGKSSLLSAILGEINCIKGSVKRQPKIAFVSQQAWIVSTTLRENIIFGKKMREKRYNRVLDYCCLRDDLKALPAGDMTEIGERGINLSGGQKQRVAIARAVYSKCDIYLLDDPLAAVDQHVAKKLFQGLIKTYLKGKTVVLVTHQLQYLHQVDRIYMLDNGKMAESGTYDQLMKNGANFSALIKSHIIETQNPHEETEVSSHRDATYVPQKKQTVELTKVQPAAAPAAVAEKEAKGKFMQAEEKSAGNVPMSIYIKYCQRGGGVLLWAFTFMLFAFVQAIKVINDWWLVYWVERPVDMSDWIYFGVYAGISVIYFIIFVLRGVLFFWIFLKAARNLHDTTFMSVLAAPMSFFDTTPIGRILNRFSKDQDHVDDSLPDVFFQSLQYGATVISIFVLIAIALPWFILVLVPCMACVVVLAVYFNKSARELKRLDSMSRSPINAHLSASLQGLSVIRAFGTQKRLVEKQATNLNNNLKAFFLYYIIQRWLAWRLDLISSIIVFATAIFGVVARYDISPGILGLALSYALQMTGMFQWTVRVTSEVTSQMTSVERLLYYTDHLEKEEKLVVTVDSEKARQVEKSWPSEGAITFNDVVVAYTENLPPVLKNITFSIKPREKVGIVGRTGAGKSTFSLVLFRMVEPRSGVITIDGVDICSIPLNRLRSSLAIIPQDPVLFAGTIRYNLDPFAEYPEEEIWKVLVKVHLDQTVKQLPDQLNFMVVDNGQNFSVGERQLLCIGRALMRNSKILVLDEATAAVDIQTDEIIQKTIRESFADRTVITIAHRLNTVIDSDKIMFLDKGELKEFDVPARLLQRKESMFSKLVDATGEATASHLRHVAKEASKLNLLSESFAEDYYSSSSSSSDSTDSSATSISSDDEDNHKKK